MRDFFRGWKRKAGCVTLVLACVFAAGWVRSVRVYDELLFDNELSALGSLKGTLMYGTRADDEPDAGASTSEWALPVWRSMLLSGGTDAHIVSDITWRWQWCGFGQGAVIVAHTNGFRIDLWAVPYWFIVAPLTAVSAWLLLSKPRTTIEPAIKPASENT